MSKLPSVQDASFAEQVLQSELPVVVEFGATWCPPCRVIEPILGELSEQYAGRVQLFALDIDESPRVASQLGIQSAPTLVAFQNGQEVERWVGARRKAFFEEWFTRLAATSAVAN